MADSYRDQDDVKTIRDLRTMIELWRDFIIWLCEEELNSTVTEMEEEFAKYEKSKT